MQFHLKRGNITLELTSSPERGESEKYGIGKVERRKNVNSERKVERNKHQRGKYEKYQSVQKIEIYFIF